MTAEEFEAAKVGTTEQRDIQVRQVANGFVLVTNRRFNDDATGNQKFGIGSEGVATDTATAVAAATNFLNTGDF